MRRSVFNALTAVAVVSAAFGGGTPAVAKPQDTGTPTPSPLPACADYLSLFSTPASACQGFFDKNVLNNTDNKDNNVLIQEQAVEALLGSDIQNFDFNNYLKLESLTGNTIDFNVDLFGDVIVAMHFGGANGQENNVGNATGFFLFHFDQSTPFFTTDIPGLSNAVLYVNGTPPPPPAVPEPATWAMMLLGFGAAGTALRRSRRRDGKLFQIA